MDLFPLQLFYWFLDYLSFHITIIGLRLLLEASVVFTQFSYMLFGNDLQVGIALQQLDAFFPDNLLITAVSFLEDKSPL